MIDFIPTTVFSSVATIIIFFKTHQLNEAKRLWALNYTNFLSLHIIDSLVYLVVVIISNQQLGMLLSLSLVLGGCMFSGFTVRIQDMGNFIELISHLTPLKFVFNSQLVAIYGFNRCPQNQTSKTLLEYDINGEDIFGEYTSYAWIQIITFRLIAFVFLISIKNPKYYNYFLNYFKNKFLSKKTDEDLEFKPISKKTNNVFINQININLEEEGKYSDSDSSQYYSVCDNDSQLYERIDSDYSLSIAWIDMTLKVDKTLYSKEKLILRGIRGFAQFGTLTALMGPSGAGKTSLLKCLNGMYRSLMAEESKIYLSNCRKIRTCFIAQDQREHIMTGLTVRQSLIYASKLKNTGKQVDHEFNIKQLMDELAINDIKEVNVDKCSSGQQKRIVMAMELTAKYKPNLICVDEPTSGVDSYSALLVCNSITVN